jgi:hypothetical protein
MGSPDLAAEAWDAVDVPLKPFALDGAGAGHFALTPDSITELRSLLREGLFTYQPAAAVWLENPILFRDGQPILSVISHEGEAVLELDPQDGTSLDVARLTYRPASRWA